MSDDVEQRAENTTEVKKNGQGIRGCLSILVFCYIVWCLCCSSYHWFCPKIDGLGSVKLGSVATAAHGCTDTDFMFFEKCSWEAIPTSLEISCAYYESTNYSEDDVSHLLDVLAEQYGSSCERYAPGVTLANPNIWDRHSGPLYNYGKASGLAPTNNNSDREIDERLKQLMKTCESRTMRANSNNLNQTRSPLDNNNGEASGLAPSSPHVTNNHFYAKSDAKWYLRFKTDENPGEDEKPSQLGGPIGAYYSLYRLINFRRKRHIAVIERGDVKKEKSTPDDNARRLLIAIAWDDEIREKQSEEEAKKYIEEYKKKIREKQSEEEDPYKKFLEEQKYLEERMKKIREKQSEKDKEEKRMGTLKEVSEAEK